MRPDQRNQASECCQESGTYSHFPINSKRQYLFQDLVSTCINHFLGFPQRILLLCTFIKGMSTHIEGTRMKNICSTTVRVRISKAETWKKHQAQINLSTCSNRPSSFPAWTKQCKHMPLLQTPWRRLPGFMHKGCTKVIKALLCSTVDSESYLLLFLYQLTQSRLLTNHAVRRDKARSRVQHSW